MKLVIIISILLLGWSEGRRISEEKCEEYSKISPTKPYPHMVQVSIFPAQPGFYPRMGVLISDDYVLTHAVPKVVGSQYQVYFTETEKFDVVERYLHPYKDDTPYHDIALLKLKNKIQLDGNHRPACLWTENQFNETIAILMEWTETVGEFSISESIILTKEECSGLNPKYNASVICLNPDGEKEKTQLWSMEGSPVQVKLSLNDISENYYILGILSSIFSTIEINRQIASKTIQNLDWIEKIVWQSTNNNCGRVQVKPPNSDTFQSSVYYGEFPWHADIFQIEENFKRKHICGGVILNRDTILTAAHCVFNEKNIVLPNQLVVSIGRYSSNSLIASTRDRKVVQIIPHDNFILSGLVNDIALLKINDVITFTDYVEPICITDDLNFFNADSGIVAGWGRKQFSNVEGSITKASLSVVSDDVCYDSDETGLSSYKYYGKFCGSYRAGTSNCSGDIGSGLLFEHLGNWYLRGILSQPIDERCENTKLVLFTDVTQHYDWIINKV